MAKSNDVDQWMAESEHPLIEAVEAVRRIVLDSDPRVTECIKWKSPTFVYKGNIASVNPNTKKKVSLMFHQGAKIEGDHPYLTGGGDTVRYMYFADLEEVEARADDLRSVVQAWCAQKG